jgi:hypothetical protein
MTSSPHDPYGVGDTRVTRVRTKGSDGESSSEAPKPCLSTDGGLQLDPLKPESRVIVDQHATVNLYLSLVLPARHALERGGPGRPDCAETALIPCEGSYGVSPVAVWGKGRPRTGAKS